MCEDQSGSIDLDIATHSQSICSTSCISIILYVSIFWTISWSRNSSEMVELAHGDRVPIHWGNGQVRPKAEGIQNAMDPYWFLHFYFSMLICSSHLGISLLITFDNI